MDWSLLSLKNTFSLLTEWEGRTGNIFLRTHWENRKAGIRRALSYLTRKIQSKTGKDILMLGCFSPGSNRWLSSKTMAKYWVTCRNLARRTSDWTMRNTRKYLRIWRLIGVCSLDYELLFGTSQWSSPITPNLTREKLIEHHYSWHICKHPRRVCHSLENLWSRYKP